jgi:hypothetical protein
VDPESTGLNPAWRKSLVYTTLGTFWKDGANVAEIDAARQLLIQDMKILEGIAPDSGAYLNEVRVPNLFFFLSNSNRAVARRRPRDTNSTGRNLSLALTTTSSWPSSRNTIRNPSSSFTKVSDQRAGTRILSAGSEITSNLPLPLAL